LYQTWSRGTYNKELQCWNSVPKPITDALKKEFPEVENSCRIDTRWFVTIVEDKKMSSKAIDGCTISLTEPPWDGTFLLAPVSW